MCSLRLSDICRKISSSQLSLSVYNLCRPLLPPPLRYRWIDYQDVDPITERAHIDTTVRVHEELLGHHPSGIYQGKPNDCTRQLICEEGRFLYDCDSYADELPYWNLDYERPHLGRVRRMMP